MRKLIFGIVLWLVIFIILLLFKYTPVNGYTVKTGDTIWKIAIAHNVTASELCQHNGLSDTTIYPGQPLRIPSGLFARLVTAEAAGESFAGQVAVANTVLNRVRDPRYPNSIPEVIYQIDSGCYQYSPVLDGRINRPATESAKRAVRKAYKQDISGGAIGFYNPTRTSDKWVRSKEVTKVIGNHVFFK